MRTRLTGPLCLHSISVRRREGAILSQRARRMRDDAPPGKPERDDNISIETSVDERLHALCRHVLIDLRR